MSLFSNLQLTTPVFRYVGQVVDSRPDECMKGKPLLLF